MKLVCNVSTTLYGSTIDCNNVDLELRSLTRPLEIYFILLLILLILITLRRQFVTLVRRTIGRNTNEHERDVYIELPPIFD